MKSFKEFITEKKMLATARSCDHMEHADSDRSRGVWDDAGSGLAPGECAGGGGVFEHRG